MAKKQPRYRLSVPTPRHKTHIVFEGSRLAVCGTSSGYQFGFIRGTDKTFTLAVIDKQFMKARNPCKRCEIFAFNNIK